MSNGDNSKNIKYEDKKGKSNGIKFTLPIPMIHTLIHKSYHNRILPNSNKYKYLEGTLSEKNYKGSTM